jgi:hypothetical protein
MRGVSKRSAVRRGGVNGAGVPAGIVAGGESSRNFFAAPSIIRRGLSGSGMAES